MLAPIHKISNISQLRTNAKRKNDIGEWYEPLTYNDFTRHKIYTNIGNLIGEKTRQ